MVQRIVIGLLVLALGAAVIFGIVHGYELWRDAKVAEGDARGAARVQHQWDEDRAKAQAATLKEAADNAMETKRRLMAQERNQRAQDAEAARVRADRDAAVAAAGGVQQRAAAYLDAAGCGTQSGDSAIECIRKATSQVLDVLGRCASRAVDLAAAADDARTRGLKCEADYDALTPQPGAVKP